MAFWSMLQALVHQTAVLLGELISHLVRQRIGFLELLFRVLNVVGLAHLGITAIGQSPVDDSDPVIRLRIIGLQLDMLLVILSWIPRTCPESKGVPAMLYSDRADAIERREIVRIDREDVLKLG